MQDLKLDQHQPVWVELSKGSIELNSFTVACCEAKNVPHENHKT